MSLFFGQAIPAQLRPIVRDTLIRFFESSDNLISYRSQIALADGTMHERLRFEPSPALLELVAALRARDWDKFASAHLLNSLPKKDIGDGLAESRL